jgi:hypothetical protein
MCSTIVAIKVTGNLDKKRGTVGVGNFQAPLLLSLFEIFRTSLSLSLHSSTLQIKRAAGLLVFYLAISSLHTLIPILYIHSTLPHAYSAKSGE